MSSAKCCSFRLGLNVLTYNEEESEYFENDGSFDFQILCDMENKLHCLHVGRLIPK